MEQLIKFAICVNPTPKPFSPWVKMTLPKLKLVKRWFCLKNQELMRTSSWRMLPMGKQFKNSRTPCSSILVVRKVLYKVVKVSVKLTLSKVNFIMIKIWPSLKQFRCVPLKVANLMFYPILHQARCKKRKKLSRSLLKFSKLRRKRSRKFINLNQF